MRAGAEKELTRAEEISSLKQRHLPSPGAPGPFPLCCRFYQRAKRLRGAVVFAATVHVYPSIFSASFFFFYSPPAREGIEFGPGKRERSRDSQQQSSVFWLFAKKEVTRKTRSYSL